MKKGFTLAELLIVVTVIGVIAAIAIPTVLNTVEDQYKTLYKSAFTTVEAVVSDLSSDFSLYPTGNFYNATDNTFFCDNFTAKVNTLSTVDCSGSTIAGDPNFNTTNAMRWYGFTSDFSGNATVHVDIDGPSKGSNTDASDILEIIITPLGKVSAPAGNETNYLLD